MAYGQGRSETSGVNPLCTAIARYLKRDYPILCAVPNDKYQLVLDCFTEVFSWKGENVNHLKAELYYETKERPMMSCLPDATKL
jgi:hypothetical protein